jgi:hypothetical protein
MRCYLAIVFVLAVAMTTMAIADEKTFNVANTTPNCRDGSRATHEVCLPADQKIKSWNISTTSAAGNRSDVESQKIAPERPNCLQIVTVVQPKGEDCIRIPFGSPICNCKGRGWIELSVKVVSE